MRLRLAFSIVLLSVLRGSPSLPEGLLPAGLGINVHFIRGHEHDLDMIAAAGFHIVRTDFRWSETERVRGRYDWTAYDSLTAELAKRGLEPYFILDYSNRLYEASVNGLNSATRRQSPAIRAPESPRSVDAFARWAAAAARHFRGRRIIWEIWNEPNGAFWKPRPNVKQYSTLALATCRAIHEADPNAAVVAPASGGFPWPFLRAFLKSGVLNCVDGISVHPYRPLRDPPETAIGDFKRLGNLIHGLLPETRWGKVPMLSGEWGFPSDAPGSSLQQQAALVVREQLVARLAGARVSIWYDWKDPKPKQSSRARDFGIVTDEGAPKPAYLAAQTLVHQLAGYHYVARYNTGDTADFVLVFKNAAGESKLVLWTPSTPRKVVFELRVPFPGEVRVTAGDGTVSAVPVRSARFSYELNGAPHYLFLGTGELKNLGHAHQPT